MDPINESAPDEMPVRKNVGLHRRKAISLFSDELVKLEPLLPGQTMPLLVQALVSGIDLPDWASHHRELIEAHLFKYGALLFRGFDNRAATRFEEFVKAMCGELLEYDERSSPRSEVRHLVYTSTDYPPERAIFLHNEHSYCLTFPMKLFFHCLTPASSGGETPLADTRKVFARIPPEIRNRLIEKKWMYVRNFNGQVGLSWKDVFQTTDRAEVEDYCARNGIQCTWRDEVRLRTCQTRPAIATHPRTGDRVWFNHATFFHITTLEPPLADLLLAEFGEAELPSNSYYGDGSPIESHVVDKLRQAYLRETVLFNWQEEDILMLDNMLVAHGRAPFVGPRRILVAMAEPHNLIDN
jgi:alpha-ketoglutarate-dependent taurine dioxygenase